MLFYGILDCTAKGSISLKNVLSKEEKQLIMKQNKSKIKKCKSVATILKSILKENEVGYFGCNPIRLFFE
jgi:hypothetical protein